MSRDLRHRARSSARGRHLVRCVLALVVVLVSAGPAEAGMRGTDRLAQVVATVAGRRVEVSCETLPGMWKRDLAASHLAPQAVAYYDPNKDVIRFGPLICEDISRSRRGASLRSVRALFIAAHEAAHAAGIDDEGIANCWGLYWAQDLARTFYGVPFFSPASRVVRSYARQLQRDSPRAYRAACRVPRMTRG